MKVLLIKKQGNEKIISYLIKTFEIDMHPRHRKNRVQFRVDILQQSKELIRFRFSGGHKILDMEKNLLESDRF